MVFEFDYHLHPENCSNWTAH